MKHDLFVSYCRRDNVPDWLNAFLDQLRARHLEFSGRSLNVFFDKHSIENGAQWRHDILEGLRDSAMMLVVVSPEYFKSDYCRWEFDEFAAREFERFSVGKAIRPIYWIEIENFPNETDPDHWKADLSSRNMSLIRLKNWQEGLEDELRLRAVEQKLAEAAESIVLAVVKGVERRDLAAKSPTNMSGALSPNFVGRSRELVKLHESVAFGRLGAITSIEGIGGIGKTELAYAYAYAYAHEYPGGRWLVPCESRTDIREALLGTMAGEWSIPPESPEVSADLRWSLFQRRLAEVGKSLFVLDNVSEEFLISGHSLKRLPDKDHAAFAVTTRLGCHARPGELDVLSLEELGRSDGVALLRRFRPVEESLADLEILAHLVDEVGGHALALEVMGVYLREHLEKSLAEYRIWFDRAKSEALAALFVDPRGNTTRHGALLVNELLAPTLARLRESSPLAFSAATVAALLPPDAVYKPWLQALVVGDRPQLLIADSSGSSPWQQALDTLDYRLLLRFQGPMGRMHRLVGEILRDEPQGDGFRVEQWIKERAQTIYQREAGPLSQEIDAFESWANSRDEKAKLADLWTAIFVVRCLGQWRRPRPAVRLLHFLLVSIDPRDLRNRSVLLNETGDFELGLGRREVALGSYQEGLQIAREILKEFGRSPEALRDLSVSLNKVGDVELELGRRDVALGNYQEGLQIAREILKEFGRSPEALRDLSISLNKVGDVELGLGRREVALSSYQEGLQIAREILKEFGRSPEALRDLSVSLSKVGDVELELGRREVALGRYQEGLQIVREILKEFGRSPEALRDLSVSLDRVGDVELGLGRREVALGSYQEGLLISREILKEFGRSPEALRDLSVSLNKVGDVELGLGRREVALGSYQEGLQISREILKEFGRSPEALRDLSISLNKVGDVELGLGRREVAFGSYQEGLQIAREILKEFGRSPEALRDLSVSLNKVADVELGLGRREVALGSYQEGLQVRREILKEFGRSPEAVRDLSVSLNKVADVELGLGRREVALGSYQEGLQVRREILNEFGRSPETFRDLSISTGRVATSLEPKSTARAPLIAEGLAMMEEAILEYGEWEQFVEVREWLRSL